jgi:hypothetical protein
MNNMRILEADNATPDQYGWVFAKKSAPQHDFAIKNICAYVGPAMLYDEALNSNYYSIVVEDKSRVEEIREVFSKIEFLDEDFVSCTKLNFYDQTQLVRKYEEALKK